MGRKRYYCEYCNKSFQDNRQSRRRHLNGLSHQRSKKAYFDLYIVQSESEKGTSLLRSNLSGQEILQVWIQSHPEAVDQFKLAGGMIDDISAMMGMVLQPHSGLRPLFLSPAPILTTPPAPILTSPFTPPHMLPPQAFSTSPIFTHHIPSHQIR